MAHKILHFLIRYRIFALIFVAVVGASGIYLVLQNKLAPLPKPQPIPLNNSQTGGGATTGMQTNSSGSSEVQGAGSPVSIRLSAGQAQPQVNLSAPFADGSPLDPTQIGQILSRLPELTPQPGDQTDFQSAGQSIPPPRPGETIKQPFPPTPQAAQPVQVDSGPLKVLRFSPEGEIPVAPFLSITFNQPMVALDTLDSLRAADVPVQLEPALTGTWRWLGTRTLTFQYDSTLIDRLPKATEYRATVPAGTKSATGGVLAQAVTWTFTTPPPRVTSTYPSGEPQPRDPLFFIQFDQRIDAQAVLNTIQVSAGSQKASLQLVSEAEIKANPQWKNLLDNAVSGRWIAFKAKELLPADADVSVSIGPGTPSAEGSLLTEDAQSYTFHTYAALRVEEYGCDYGSNPCVPLAPFFIRFNNPLDTKSYDPSWVQVAPELPGASVNIYGNQVQIQGESRGQTTYTVTLSGKIQDTFGQKLGRDLKLTFKVGPADPALYGPGQNFITLDPAAPKPVFSVYDINYPRLDVKIYAVQPSDWLPFKYYLQDFQRTDAKLKVPGREVMNKTLPVEAASDSLTEVDIDLSPLMDGKFGQFIVIVAPPKNLLKDPQNQYWQTIQAWVQVTQIGLDAFTDASDMVVWTSALKDGSPLPGISVEAGPGGQKWITGDNGTARFAIPDGAAYLVASQGADRAILPHSNYMWGDDAWNLRPVGDELRWFVFDDRQMYRPGEEVHVKGWMRRIGSKQDGDVGLVGGAVTSLSYQIMDSQNNAIGSGQADVNALGGFDFSFTLPQQINLGYTQLLLTPSGSLQGFENQPQQFYHSFQVQEFRRPEFEVAARNETTGPYFAGGNATVAVKASYYAGGPLPNSDVTWQVSSTPSSYAPPNWPDFTFGDWVPWWGEGPIKEGPFGPVNGAETKVETFTGKTDAGGEHFLRLDFSPSDDPRPVSVLAQATVMDVNRQAWGGQTTLLVHPADLYVGLRSDRYFVEQGTPLKVDFIVTDLDGNPVSDRPVEVRAARLDWKYQDGAWQEVEVDVQTCSQGSAQKPVTCTFQTPIGGSYKITAVVTDDQGRKNQSRFTRWVSGGKLPPARDVQQEMLTLIPDKETYQAGDVAHILVQSPFSPAEGLLALNRSGFVSTSRFTLKNGSATLDIPIEEKYTPNLNIQVDVNGSAPRNDDQGNALPGVSPRPAFATGQLDLKIPPVQRTLTLSLIPEQSELEPGGETTLGVVLKDASGAPVSDAELAVVVVDEAILALSNYQMADPLQVFYTDRPLDLTSVYARASIILANPQALAANSHLANQAMEKAADGQRQSVAAGAPPAAPAATATQAPAASDLAGGPANQPIRVRTDFNPLAVFAPAVHTDANGAASVQVKLPDNLTRYRVMVVAVDSAGRQFGMTESNLTARLPLMVRPSAPRFLNFGDKFELPVVLQNQTGEPLIVDVAVRASNLTLTGASGLRVTVPARDRVEVRFPAEAQMAGTARLQIAAVSGSYADAATLELPVYTPATSEAFAVYGVIDQGAVAQPVAAPQGVFPQYGGLEISTSSTALQALTDAVLYLVAYPYDCTEQISSRILAVSALRDVLTAFKAQGLPAPAEMESSVKADIQSLQGLQNDDGGFPYWRRGQESSPFNTIHAAHALYRAQSKGFSVPADMQQRALEYLRQIESHYPSWYGQNTRWTLSAYALYVRDLMGDKDPNKALKLLDEAGLENLSLDAIGWLWPVIKDAPDGSERLDAIRRFVNNHAVETAGAANFTTNYDDQNYLLLGSDRRTDAILLDAMINDQPHSDLIPKIVNGLLAQRTQGRWTNTQENIFVLLALDHYFNTFETQTPDFVARIWLGQNYAGSQQFQGRTTDRKETDVPMSYLVDPALGGTQDLILSKEGDGRLYYRLGLTYAPTSLKLDPLDMGFTVRRVYEAVDDPKDVRQDADGTWHIKAGARVRVHLTMETDNRRYHVALVDPLPAGLEIINPDLDVSGSLPQDPNQPAGPQMWWWWRPWYEHQNLRDERAEAFTTLLWDGVYQYTYTTRATTPGTFVVPPTKAEEMYSPEVFGRSGSDIVIIE